MHVILLADAWQIVVYIAVILVAIVSLVALVALILLVLEVKTLVSNLRGEVKALSRQAQDTVKSVQGTTEFVSSGLAKPLIHTASIAAGIARTVSVIRSGVFRPRPETFERGE